MPRRRILAASAVALALSVSACDDHLAGGPTRHLSPIPPATLSLMAAQGMSKSDPILLRAYKKESEMELWKRGADGRYALLKTYPICRWSGQLGPKKREGDRQAPEGFYSVGPAQLNPNSAYYLSFDTGYPNAYDRAHGRSGSNLMVHGTCSSRGCFAMTDAAIAEVYAIAREAFSGGQRAFQFQSYPFRMNAENMAKLRSDPNMPFWQNLKEGSDYFEVVREEPRVAVCGGRYVFGGTEGGCAPKVEPAVAEKRERDERRIADLVGAGTPAVKIVYEDGGGHSAFHKAMVASAGGSENALFPVLDSRPRNLGQISRPEALAMGPREIAAEPAKGKIEKKPATALAFAPSETDAVKPAGRTQTAVAPKTESGSAVPAPRATEAAGAPRRVEVAAAGDSSSLYAKVLGSLTGGARSAPGPSAEPAPAPTPSAKSPASAKASPEPARKAEGAKAQGRLGAEPERRAGALPPARPAGQ